MRSKKRRSKKIRTVRGFEKALLYNLKLKKVKK